MTNAQLKFLDCNSNAFSGKKITLTPLKAPQTTGSWLATIDNYQFVTSASGCISASIVANNYKAEIATPTPDHSFYLAATETDTTLISGSVMSGSAQNVYFNTFDFVKRTEVIKKVTVTPTWNYPYLFSGSIIVLSSTASVPQSGVTTFNALVPGIYQVDVLGPKVVTTFNISVPNFSGSWNAKDLIVVKPAKGIPVKLTNQDNSYVLTVSSSDARYALKGATGGGSGNIDGGYPASVYGGTTPTDGGTP